MQDRFQAYQAHTTLGLQSASPGKAVREMIHDSTDESVKVRTVAQYGKCHIKRTQLVYPARFAGTVFMGGVTSAGGNPNHPALKEARRKGEEA